MRDLAQIKILDSDHQGPAQEIDLLPQRRRDLCVSVRCRIGSLCHSGMVVVWFGLMLSSLLICGSDALDSPVEFSPLPCWLLPDTERQILSGW